MFFIYTGLIRPNTIVMNIPSWNCMKYKRNKTDI